MEKTTYYQLNKPEAADPLRVADFNENADKIDAALKQVDDNSVTRSAQVRSEAANALAAYQTANDAAVAAKGNCRVVVGTYTGTGTYGSSNKNSLTFDAEPLFLLINGGGYTAYLSETGRRTAANSGGDSIRSMVTYWGKTISWYSSGNDQLQLNVSGTTYTYMAFFA